MDNQDDIVARGGKLEEADTCYGRDILDVKGLVQASGKWEQGEHRTAGIRLILI